jgi:hypothetical protein
MPYVDFSTFYCLILEYPNVCKRNIRIKVNVQGAIGKKSTRGDTEKVRSCGRLVRRLSCAWWGCSKPNNPPPEVFSDTKSVLVWWLSSGGWVQIS